LIDIDDDDDDDDDIYYNLTLKFHQLEPALNRQQHVAHSIRCSSRLNEVLLWQNLYPPAID
jgi:hypothetical protein